MGGKIKAKIRKGPMASTCVARRRLNIDDGGSIVIQLHSPCPDKDQGYLCEYEILHAGDIQRDTVWALSSIEVMQIAMWRISVDLEHVGQITHFDGQPNSNGFEPYHRDTDMNSLLDKLVSVEAESIASLRTSFVENSVARNGGPKESRRNSKERLEANTRCWADIVRLRQQIQTRIVALAGTSGTARRLLEPCRIPTILPANCDTTQHTDPIGELQLVRQDTGARVDLRIWAPTLAKNLSEWHCKYQVDGLDEAVTAQTVGSDSMAALFAVFHAATLNFHASNTGVVYAEENDNCPKPAVYFGRFLGASEFSNLMEHVFAVEVASNQIFYDELCSGSEIDRTSAEQQLYFHLQEAEKRRLTIRRNRLFRPIIGRPLINYLRSS